MNDRLAVVAHGPKRLWTDSACFGIVTASPRLATEMEALGDTVIEYVRADQLRGAVELIRSLSAVALRDIVDGERGTDAAQATAQAELDRREGQS